MSMQNPGYRFRHNRKVHVHHWSFWVNINNADVHTKMRMCPVCHRFQEVHAHRTAQLDSEVDLWRRFHGFYSE